MSELPLLTVLALAGIGSGFLVAVSLGAFVRRRSWSYFLVTIAIGTLVLRTILGVVTLGELVSLEVHHLLEHVLDLLIVGLLFGAVYLARTVAPRDEREYEWLDEDPHD